MYIIVGLGNPGGEYQQSRHNTGRMATEFMAGKVSGVKIIIPNTFMNKTGGAVARAVKDKQAAQKLIVIHDDLDLPLGALKISYNRGSGGHKGVESIIGALKTREFIRIRIGIGKRKNVEKHILGEFKKPEMETMKKVLKEVKDAVETIATEGLEKAMNRFN